MRLHIIVADFWPKLHTYASQSDELPGDISLPERILYLPIPRKTRVTQLDSLVTQLPSALRRSIDVVILRAHKNEAKEILTNPVIGERLSLRFETTPIWLLYWDKKGFHIKRLTESFRLPTGDSRHFFIRALREAESYGITTCPGVLLPKVPQFHYEGPNGVHYATFLRVGTGLLSPDFLDAITFWTLPYILKHDLILLDAAPMLPLGLNVRTYLLDQGFTKEARSLKVACLHLYEESSEILLSKISNLVDDIHSARVLYLSSVSSRGNLANRIMAALESVNVAHATAISLFAMPERDAMLDDIFCRLGDDFKCLQPCELCEKHNPAVKIDRLTFEVEISTTVTQQLITQGDTKHVRQFIERYSQTHCLTVHRDQDDGSRHHMVHVDVDALLKSHIFNEKLAEQVKSFDTKPDVILCTTHRPALGLARRVSDIFGGVPVINCDETKLESLDWTQRETLNGARTILLVDDVTITGDRLRGYKQFLGRGKFIRDNTTLKCLIGVARTVSSKDLQLIADMFHERKHFKCVETLLLPDWRAGACPWCRELEEIKRRSQLFAKSEAMKSRYNQLSAMKTGLKQGLFMDWAEPNPDAWKLGPGSVFADMQFDAASEIDVFVSVASSIQSLRDRSALNDQFTTPVCKILDPNGFLTGRYYAPVIQASVLRASHQHDLRSVGEEKRLKEAVESVLRLDASVPLRAELVFAMCQQKLPVTSSIKADLFHNADPGLAAFFSAALNLS